MEVKLREPIIAVKYLGSDYGMHAVTPAGQDHGSPGFECLLKADGMAGPHWG